ncbi:MAG: alpha/beta hydrolase [Solirubrobacterales bacterium]
MSSLEKLSARLGVRLLARLLRLPPVFVNLLAGRPPKAAPGLHPQALLIGRLDSLPRPGSNLRLSDIVRQRELLEVEASAVAGTVQTDVTRSEHLIPGPAGPLPARLFTPSRARNSGPLLVFFHGGGWVLGSRDSHDGACQLLAEGSGVRVLSVEYRLAPEHPFPAAFDDALAAFRFVAANPEEFGADPARIAVGGDSAGGNLAAVVTNALRGEGPLPAFQLLIYPVVDVSTQYPSYSDFAHGFYLTADRMRTFIAAYVPEEDRGDPRAAPLLEQDLVGLPPTYICTALADPLRDEGEAYARRLDDANVQVARKRFPQIHGFINMNESRAARDATAEIAAALKAGLRVPASERELKAS